MPRRNPCQPYHSNSILYEWTDDLLGQLVQVHRPSVSGVSVAVASRGRAPPSLRTTGLRSRSISGLTFPRPTRSEERRVGKERRSRLYGRQWNESVKQT